MFTVALNFLKGIVGKVLLIIIVATACFVGGCVKGQHMETAKVATVVQKADVKITKTNDATQAVADKIAQAQVVYRDRVVTQYKVINRDVVKYVEKENTTPSDVVWLPAEWVRLHDASASTANGDNSSTSSASGVDATSSQAPAAEPVSGTVAVKSGKALEIINENYKSYGICQSNLISTVKLYNEMRDRVNQNSDPK